MGRERMLGELGPEVLDLVNRLERLTLGTSLGISDRVVAQLRQRVAELEDPVLAPLAARAIMGALHPYEDPPRAFWASETGLGVAHAIGYHREVVPFMQAAWILNVSRQRVHQLCELERLVRVESPREGVWPASLRLELWSHGRRKGR